VKTVVRRARPALGTLVELGILLPGADPARPPPWALAALAAGFEALGTVEQATSAFLPESDVGRFNSARAGATLPVTVDTARVLRMALRLSRATDGLFDVTCRTGLSDWSLGRLGGAALLCKHAPNVRLDLGGVAKGYAVDRALEAMTARARSFGRRASCWVNAGGDLRTQGVVLRVCLRDERGGGAWPWLTLRRGALATSDFAPTARARLAGGRPRGLHVSVLSPRCLWSDALTKVVALSGRCDHPLISSHQAFAFVHDAALSGRNRGSEDEGPPVL